MKKVIMCIAVLASLIGVGLGCWKMETENTVDVTKFNEKSLHGVAIVQREQYMVLNTKKEPYLKRETYDHNNTKTNIAEEDTMNLKEIKTIRNSVMDTGNMTRILDILIKEAANCKSYASDLFIEVL